MCYNYSPSSALMSIYPEHKWQLEKFKNKPAILWSRYGVKRRLFLRHNIRVEKTPKGFWKGYWKRLEQDANETTRIMEWLGKQLSIKKLDDWYRISITDLKHWVPIGSSKHLGKLLALAYPKHCWNSKIFGQNHPKSSQRAALLAVQQLFPSHSRTIFLH